MSGPYRNSEEYIEVKHQLVHASAWVRFHVKIGIQAPTSLVKCICGWQPTLCPHLRLSWWAKLFAHRTPKDCVYAQAADHIVHDTGYDDAVVEINQLYRLRCIPSPFYFLDTIPRSRVRYSRHESIN